VNGVARAAAIAMTCAACSRAPSDGGASPSSGRLSLSLRGRNVAGLSSDEISRLGESRTTVNDPHEHARVEMRAVPLTRVLDHALGTSWRTAVEVVATCADGFEAVLPVALILEREPFVAIGRTDSADFAVQDGPSRRTPVGPFYIVWREDSKEPPPEPQWPYQVQSIEVTDYEARFAPTLPPADSDSLVTRGFERFRTVCLPCHSVNGSGGSVGPELNYPVNVTEYFAEPVLRKWIADPTSVRHGAKMPRPLPSGEESGPAIDELVAYLKAMAKRKIPPRGAP
jgi:mono/diheme cytochrome c family protein